MAGIKISDSKGFVEATIIPRKDTYYLVTDENLKNIKGKNVLTDLFVLIASILWGAFFSVKITIEASSNIVVETEKTLLIYQGVFFVTGIIFTILASLFIILAYRGIEGIKKTSLPSDESEDEKIRL